MTDDDRQNLGRADPARSLPPLDPTAWNELLEDTMSQTDEPIPGGKRRVVLLGVAAAAMVAIAVGVGVSRGGSSDDGAPSEAKKDTVTELSTGPAVAAKCAVPSPQTVANQDVAFEGRVISVKDGLVILDPTRFYKGTETDRVTVNQPDLNMSELPVDFQVGQDYIVGATDGNVSICGLSGLASEDLRALYDAAFPQ